MSGSNEWKLQVIYVEGRGRNVAIMGTLFKHAADTTLGLYHSHLMAAKL